MAATMVTVNGAAIRAIRTNAKLPATALADHAGISRSYLCDIEMGRNDTVRRIVVRALADMLDVPTADLIAA